MRILLVDDDPADVYLFKRSCPDKWEVENVDSVTEASIRVARREFDVVVLDLNLVDMWGDSAIRVMSKTFPVERVIVWSGYAGDIQHPDELVVDKNIEGSLVHLRIAIDRLGQ